MRGAQEVKEHPWLKYFTWKEMYDKTLEAPFIPKLGDNFDSKYCNAPDKIGLDTKEKYENYLRNESFKDAFNGFTHNQLDSEEEAKKSAKESKIQSSKTNQSAMIMNTREALKNMKFSNPHMNITNVSMSTTNLYKDCSISYLNNSSIENKNNLSSINIENKNCNLSSIENKFLKMKKQAASSSSTSSLLRQYKMSNISNNSTSTSINYLHRRTGSTGNYQQQ